jgi:KipI family sensor histidine kinase inhibitor
VIADRREDMSVEFIPAGDAAIQVEFEEEISPEVNARVRALEHLLGRSAIPGVVEIVPSFRALLVYYDPRIAVYEALKDSIAELVPLARADVLPPARLVELPCCYADPELGFDLEPAAQRLGLAAAELVRLHSASEHLVYFIGFAPGQPYIAGGPERLEIPRLATPRTKTPAGSVGIGGRQSCIYSIESPGGFWVLGRTPVRLFDPLAVEPVLLRPGDRIRFRPIGRPEFDDVAARVGRRAYRPPIT